MYDFDVNASDGSFNKQFETMREAEEYFGPELIYSNVSVDGVQTFYPADKTTENALHEYRDVRRLANNNSAQNVFPSEVGINDELLAAANYQAVVQADNCWILRGEDHVKMARAMLCDADFNEQLMQCRQDVLMVIGTDHRSVFVRDLAKTADSLSDLAARPLEQIDGRSMELLFPNEDTGQVRKIPLGIFASSEAVLDEVVEKFEASGLEEHLNWTSHSRNAAPDRGFPSRPQPSVLSQGPAVEADDAPAAPRRR